MISKDEIIQEVLSNRDYERLCKSIDPNGDLFQEFILYLLEQPENELQQRYEYINYYCVRIITRSSFYREKYEKYYNKHTGIDELFADHDDSNIDELLRNEIIYTAIGKALESETTYHRELFLAATSGITDCVTNTVKTFKSLRNLSIETGIPYTTLSEAVNATRKRVKEKVQDLTRHSA